MLQTMKIVPVVQARQTYVKICKSTLVAMSVTEFGAADPTRGLTFVVCNATVPFIPASIVQLILPKSA